MTGDADSSLSERFGGFFDGDAGLEQFTDEKAADPKILNLAGKISYVIDPDNGYPRNYSGHIRVTVDDDEVVELRQPHMRGGVREPLTVEHITAKFYSNAAFGGWPEPRARALLDYCRNLASHADMSGLKAFRA